MLKAAVGGLVGGAVGAAIWAALAYFSGREYGIVAIVIGMLVGGGVRLGAGQSDGWTPGLLAAGLAIGAIVVGKYAAVAAVVSQVSSAVTAQSSGPLAEEAAISIIADEVVRERERAGTTVAWPAGVEEGEATQRVDYPADIWAEAEQRWVATHPAYRDAALTRPELASREYRIALMAHLIVEQKQGGYASYQWPIPADEREFALLQDEFPAELWGEAQARLDAMDDAGHQQFAQWAAHRLGEQMEAAVQYLSQSMTQYGFASSFSAWDALWFFLAVGSAFKLGSGMASDA